ncbi:MAG TPA: class I SAM-dependent methyltransferase [Candidatus Bathyarchaeia archaeon]|nr:class I SAM-dependent methyltransferase [Candidatus Bathyarchaeia archaeon]
MSDAKPSVPDYGNWFSARILIILAVVAIILAALSFVFLPAIVGAGLFVFVFGYYAYARYTFSARGGDLQAQVRALVLDHLEWYGHGHAIDIGCGNGPLVIEIAKKFPDAHVTGVDYWGGKFEYSKQVCEENAEIEGVADRVSFRRASASALPFDDESFDAAVSNLAFHEVRDANDKREVIKEVLRVVKKDGAFAFQDIFLKRVYGDVEELLQTIRGWGVARVEFIDTGHVSFLPRILRVPFGFGAMGILCGRK